METLEAGSYWQAISEHSLDIIITLGRDFRIRSVNRVIAPLVRRR
jgi:hypothetical protein